MQSSHNEINEKPVYSVLSVIFLGPLILLLRLIYATLKLSLQPLVDGLIYYSPFKS